MNKVIKEQLKKITRITVPEYNENTTELTFIKSTVEDKDISLYNKYKIKLENYIVNEPDNFTLSTNWNRGTKPTDFIMIVTIEQIMGKMVRVTGEGFNDKQPWFGWLPRKGFKVLEEV